jgi:Spy/CpxP family protein refolding chaperone
MRNRLTALMLGLVACVAVAAALMAARQAASPEHSKK